MLKLEDLLCRLVSIPSLSGEEQEIARFVADILSKFCDRVHIDEMFNVIAEIAGSRPGRTVVFNSHLDTVPPGDMPDPYDGRIVSAELYGESGRAVRGRGACDDKHGVAAMMVAAERLAADRDFAGKLILTFVVQEENGQAPGTCFAMSKLGCKTDFAVLGEATGLDFYLGHRGKVEFFLDIYGKSAHASNPSNGINALELLGDFIRKMNGLKLPCHEVLGQCTWALTFASCPDPGKAAMVPAFVTARFDRRYLPDESPRSVEKEINALLREIEAEKPGCRFELRQNYVMPPYYIDPGCHEVQLMQEKIKELTGREAAYKSWISGTDGTFMYNDFGLMTVGFGPGSEKNIHSSADHVLIEELEIAAAFYEAIVRG